jgi:DNA invertase Pin-like site-specific DNA recombinase
MALIGYARVSTEEQHPIPSSTRCGRRLQDQLRGAGLRRESQCLEFARSLEHIGPGDTLVVAGIDRLARSLALLESDRAAAGLMPP